ncbi:glycine cleavage system protein GcvH [Desulfosporosinus nitroreducens]|uniref:Glycine cleavage system H protein n=1 Tax=Desulfosporosinus nitroreducens TaxID=2018668 RepID=A0ABT8QQ37_9FIRM|nr:glycine cleavage system protein GcvH [Desulfosporosinus nitroreducens]MDO0822735.1 glycine cleavage system protein GcvH [Desulfosporosinus nitroreducens]
MRYCKEHTWAKIEGDLVKVGITDFAQSQLGDIIFVELPQVGDEFDHGQVFGQAESAKSVSSLYMPISGEIRSVNDNVEESPDLVNTSPYDEGWMIILKPRDLSEVSALLSKEEYTNLLKETP